MSHTLRPKWINSTVHRSRRPQTVVCFREEMAPNTVGHILKSSASHVLLDVSRKVFDDAEQQIRQHCSRLADSRAADRCARVLDALHHTRAKAEEGCALEDSTSSGSACQQLEGLEKLIYELSYCDVDTLCMVLAAKFGVNDPHDSTALDADSVGALDEDLCRSVFEEADVAHHDVLDKEQLLWALGELGVHMSHAEVNRALITLDAHGYVTYDAFLAILKTQELREQDAGNGVGGRDEGERATSFLSAIPHARPSWWSDAPHEIDCMW